MLNRVIDNMLSRYARPVLLAAKGFASTTAPRERPLTSSSCRRASLSTRTAAECWIATKRVMSVGTPSVTGFGGVVDGDCGR